MAEPSPPIALSVGDRVVYPNQGVCRVSGVEAKEVAGQKLTFVTMRREEDGALVMVPQTKIQAIGVRKVASSKEIDEIVQFLKSDSDKANLDWKQRARTNSDRMAQGGILGLAEVVKGLQVLSELRPLPTKERELYDNARHLLVAEMAASLDLPECDCEDAIDLILFPPGRERPKRTAEEFRPPEGEDDLELGDDLLGMGDDLGIPEDDGQQEESSGEEDAGEQESEEEDREPSKKKGPKVRLSDEDVTQPMGNLLADAEEPLPSPKKRGRPPKPKPAAQAAPAAPKKRGRPPKSKPAAQAASVPKKRGRPPKAAAKPAPVKGKKK
jgi:CarD family transcriptional regulator